MIKIHCMESLGSQEAHRPGEQVDYQALHFLLLSSKFRPPASPPVLYGPTHNACGVTKNLRPDSSETQGKTKYCCSTKESSNKRTPNDMELYSQISVAIIRESSSAAGGKK